MISKIDFLMINPELFLLTAIIVALMVGTFSSKNIFKSICYGLVAILGVTVFLVGKREAGQAFSGMLHFDLLSNFFVCLSIIATIFSIIITINYAEKEKINKFELPILMVLSVLGMMIMLYAQNLLLLYLGLELQSLPLYILAAFQRDKLRPTESGLKYFVLGALSSGMLLYGISMIYGYTGSIDFTPLHQILENHNQISQNNLGFVIGLIFILVGFAFKISAVPFHMWTPDVYEGAPTPITAFFASAPKIASLGVFIQLMMGPFQPLLMQWQQIVIFMSVASMILAALAALGQKNIKRLMAYSSIGHIGYILIGLITANTNGLQSILIYLVIYWVTNLGAFACITMMRTDGKAVEGINDLAGLSKYQPLMAFAFAVFMFSMAGIPPLAGFLAKFYVFKAAIESGYYILSIIGVLSSVVAAFYYLRVIKVMYFDQSTTKLDPVRSWETSIVITLSTCAVIGIFIIPSFLITQANLIVLDFLK
ncbi:MAG: NADH-quinone oxidoreductase subunit NuoN [Alphaproteobacteria bacterium]|nr:NADH-quinone oxidoreductase subunit NuoN [Alphaproteobacteria bacterium]